MPIKPINLEQFVNKARNVHEAIVAASKRSRQINEQVKIEFNQRIELFVPKQETEGEENDINPDQLKVSLEFEKRPKPTDIALDELMQGNLEWKYREKEELPVAAEDEGDEASEDEE